MPRPLSRHGETCSTSSGWLGVVEVGSETNESLRDHPCDARAVHMGHESW